MAHRIVPAPERLDLAERADAGDLHARQSTTTTSVPASLQLALDLGGDVRADEPAEEPVVVGAEDDEPGAAIARGRRDLLRDVAGRPDVVGLHARRVDLRPRLREDRLQLRRLDERDHPGLAGEVAEALRPFRVEGHVLHRDDDERVAGALRLLDRPVERAARDLGVVEPDQDRPGHLGGIVVARSRRRAPRPRD